MAWIRDQISYVAQEPVLFSGTIRENLLYGRVDASEEEMVEAAKLVKADGFIRQFPKHLSHRQSTVRHFGFRRFPNVGTQADNLVIILHLFLQ